MKCVCTFFILICGLAFSVFPDQGIACERTIWMDQCLNGKILFLSYSGSSCWLKTRSVEDLESVCVELMNDILGVVAESISVQQYVESDDQDGGYRTGRVHLNACWTLSLPQALRVFEQILVYERWEVESFSWRQDSRGNVVLNAQVQISVMEVLNV